MSEMHEHLEHAEHAGHGADPFTLRVAMTMAIIAAVLAAVSLIAHRKHNEALQKQGDANRLKTESAEYEVKSSNTFAWYQAKRARVEQAANSQIMARLLAPIQVPLDAPDEDSKKEGSALEKARAAYKQEFASRVAASEAESKKWEAYIKKNDTKQASIKVDEEGFPVKNDKGEDDETLGALIVKGTRFKKLADEKTHAAEEAIEKYGHVHHQADGLDWAHLTVELGLVLCTICVLTKKREYWLLGILSALIGVGLTANALMH